MNLSSIEKTVVEQMSDAVYVRDRDKNLAFVNAAAERLTGYPRREALGMKCFEVFGDEGGTCRQVCPVDRVITEGQAIRHHEGKLETRSKSVRDMQVSISPVFEQEEVTGAVVVMQDVTKLRQMEKTNVKALIALEQERALFVSGPVVVFKWQNAEGWPAEYVSANSSRLTGRSQEEWMAGDCRYSDLISQEDQARVMREVVDACETGAEHIVHEPYRLVLPDNSVRWVVDHTTVLRDSTGDISHFLGYIVDITKQKEAETLLLEAKENFRIFFDSIGHLCFVLDERGDILEVNRAVSERLGHSAEELVGQSVLSIHPESRRGEALQIVTEMIAGEADVCHVPLITKEGRTIPVETSVFPGTWSGRDVLFGVTKDVSLLAVSEEKFSKTFYSSPVSITLSSLSEGRLLEVNDKFTEVFGFARDEAIGRTSHELGIWQDPVVRDRLARELNEGGGIRDLDLVLQSKGGESRHVVASAEIVDIQETPTLLTVVNDVTDQKRAEAAREELIIELREALAKVKTLSGLLPMCANCKKIRDDGGYWNRIEEYITHNSDAEFSHGICPECAEVLYPGFVDDK